MTDTTTTTTCPTCRCVGSECSACRAEREKQEAAAARQESIDFIRHICDKLEENPDLPNLFTDINYYAWGWDHEDVKQVLTDLRRALGGTFDKTYDDGYFRLKAKRGDTRVEFIAQRDAICERRVVGTEMVEVEEYDAKLLAEVPKVTVTKEQEIVEWICPEAL
jgi:hypothetical protein